MRLLKLVLASMLATLTGCVATMQGAYTPAQDMEVSWFGRDLDRVRPGGLAAGDGVVDGHFRIDLNLPTEEEVRAVKVFQTDAAGTFGGLGYGVWSSHSANSLNWVVGVFDGERQLNSTMVPSLGKFRGQTSLDAYVAENEWIGHLRPGNFVVVEVIHGNDKSSKRLVDLSKISQSAPPPTETVQLSEQPARSAHKYPTTPAVTQFPRGPEAPEDIAVIIGNADYASNQGSIPDVAPAHADAEGFKLWVTQSKGIKPGNIIYIRDATSARLVQVFGSRVDHRGKLYDWVKAGQSNVYVYYAGHGAPGDDGGSYLVPTDAEAARVKLVGYPLSLMYENLGKLPAKSVTVVLEACFSGISQAGTVIPKASPVYLKAATPKVPANITVYAAGAANQMASWDQDGKHSLFTKYFLLGFSGKADEPPHGNGDGRVTTAEMEKYLQGTLTYYARRFYGRDQTAQIVKGVTKQ